MFPSRPSVPAILRDGETYFKFAGITTLRHRIVIISHGQVGRLTGSGAIHAQAGKKVIDRALGRINRNASDRAPFRSVGGRAHDDVVGGASTAKSAVAPDHIDLSRAIH